MTQPPWKAHLQLVVTFGEPQHKSCLNAGAAPFLVRRRHLLATGEIAVFARNLRFRTARRVTVHVLRPPDPDQGQLGLFLRCGVHPGRSEEKPGFHHVRAPSPARAGPWGGKRLFPSAEFTWAVSQPPPDSASAPG